MAEFLLMRHAKSEHPPGVPDRERPLSARGMASAAAVGRAVSDFGAVPDTILSSPAVRARETARIARSEGGWDATVELVDDLYDGGVADLLDALAAGAGRVLVVGHEPTWSMAVSSLIGGGAIRMATAAVACLEGPTPPVPASASLRWMIHPRLLLDR